MDSIDATYRTVSNGAAPEPMTPAPSRLRQVGLLVLAAIAWVWRLIVRWRRATVPLGILLAAIIGMVTLVSTKPVVVEEKKPERVWPVDAAVATLADHEPMIPLLGSVASGRSADLRPLVAGAVVEMGPAANDGGIVRKGDLILAIDPLDYRLAATEAKAMLAEARARLEEFRATATSEEQQAVLRRRDLERVQELHAKGTVATPRLEQAQIAVSQQEQAANAARARVRQQEAVVDRMQASATKAETDLERTRLTAPFDGFLGSVMAEQGMRVGPGDRVAVLSGTEAMEAQVTLPTEVYGRLSAQEGGLVGRPAQVVWKLGQTEMTFPARITRVIDRISNTTGGVGLFVTLEGNHLDTPLRPGAFVEVRIPDRKYVDVVQLPPTAIHGQDMVYVVDGDGRLARRTVTVAARDGGQVFVSAGLATGDKVVTTRFQEIAPGIKVAVRGDAPAVAPAAETTPAVKE